MARIFISYSRADAQFMETFIPFIRRSFPHIIFWYDREIHGGADWWEMILSEIDKADIFMYLMSNDSLKSSYCRSEMEEALRLKKLLLPVVIRPKTEIDLLPDDLARIIHKTNWVDLSKNIKDTEASSNLFGSINILVNRIPEQPPMPQWVEPTPEPLVPDKKTAITPRLQPDRRWVIGVVILLLILAGIVAGFLLLNGEGDPQGAENTPYITEEILDIALVVATLDAQATFDQGTAVEFASVEARATQYALPTQQALNASATAASWTDTPTPNVTASIDAYRTQQAGTVTQEWVNSWTATPTNTATFTATPSPTPNMTATTQAAQWFPNGRGLSLDNPVTANDQWTPVIQEFDGVEMVLVPAGCFMMGSEDDDEDEKPVHEQCFEEPFWMDRTEVTNAQYAKFIAAGGYENPDYWTEAGWQWREENTVTEPRYWADDRYNAPQQPVVGLSWYEAFAYAQWRGARLPTEREWEYAARGPDGLIYPWGNAFDANNLVYSYSGNNDGRAAAVGSRPEGAAWVGVWDMAGNVWEWTRSQFMPYPYNPNDGREQEGGAFRRVLRGGSWYSTPDDARAAYRSRGNPDARNYFFGFRVVCASPFSQP